MHRIEAPATVNAIEAVDMIEREIERIDWLAQAHAVGRQPVKAARVVAANNLRVQA
jgi:hypothetical protein